MAREESRRCKRCNRKVLAVTYGDGVAGVHGGTYVSLPDGIDLDEVAGEEHGMLGPDEVF